MKKALILFSALIIGGCGMKPDTYTNLEPKLDFKEYFTGPIKAWGLVQDHTGNVVRRFDVDMVGTWEDNKGTLEEYFTYYDGEKQKRVWYLTKLEDGRVEGRADDILGTATGNEYGTAVQFKYQMNLPVGDRTFKLTFDDWMFQMNDGVIINRSYIKKFGITVAELTLFLQKQDQ